MLRWDCINVHVLKTFKFGFPFVYAFIANSEKMKKHTTRICKVTGCISLHVLETCCRDERAFQLRSQTCPGGEN